MPLHLLIVFPISFAHWQMLPTTPCWFVEVNYYPLADWSMFTYIPHWLVYVNNSPLSDWLMLTTLPQVIALVWTMLRTRFSTKISTTLVPMRSGPPWPVRRMMTSWRGWDTISKWELGPILIWFFCKIALNRRSENTIVQLNLFLFNSFLLLIVKC